MAAIAAAITNTYWHLFDTFMVITFIAVVDRVFIITKSDTTTTVLATAGYFGMVSSCLHHQPLYLIDPLLAAIIKPNVVQAFCLISTLWSYKYGLDIRLYFELTRMVQRHQVSYDVPVDRIYLVSYANHH